MRILPLLAAFVIAACHAPTPQSLPVDASDAASFAYAPPPDPTYAPGIVDTCARACASIPSSCVEAPGCLSVCEDVVASRVGGFDPSCAIAHAGDVASLRSLCDLCH